MEPLFEPYCFGDAEREIMDRGGHFLLPGIMTPSSQEKMTAALAHVEGLINGYEGDLHPNRYAAEYNEYLASLIAHPQMVELARNVLGDEIRYDHCVTLNRPGGNGGQGWHSHEYSDDDPNLGFVRIFFYVNGFTAEDGGLRVVPGSHLFRDARLHAHTDDDLRDGWMKDKTHPMTGEPLDVGRFDAPAGSVILMWTHAAHAVTGRKAGSPTRWTVVYAYRNPGRTSRARWISEAFEKNPYPGAEGLMPLY